MISKREIMFRLACIEEDMKWQDEQVEKLEQKVKTLEKKLKENK